jgi:hypothetical protein
MTTKSKLNVTEETSGRGGILSDIVSTKEHQAAMLLEVAKRWGLFAGIAIFFIYVGTLQFNKLDTRVAEGERFVREKLTDVVQANTLALHDVSQQHDVLVRSLDQNTHELQAVAEKKTENNDLLRSIATTLEKINENKAIQPVQPVVFPAAAPEAPAPR